MSRERDTGMQVLYARVCGLDVHKKVVVACVRILDAKGVVHSTVRRFGTMSADLLELRQWLAEAEVTHVAMESTGVYWQPVFNLLEGHFEVWLVNAQHIKKVPGRKTDVKDAEWIAQLLQCGLLRPSLVPDRKQREVRDLTRQRSMDRRGHRQSDESGARAIGCLSRKENGSCVVDRSGGDECSTKRPFV